MFEFNGEAGVGFDELYALGQARRKLGHTHPVWTREKNQELMGSIGAPGKDHVTKLNFVSHFNRTLPRDVSEFDQIIFQFVECARGCTESKTKAKREAQNKKGIDDKREAGNKRKEAESKREAENEKRKTEGKRREAALQGVYREFDIDGDGHV